ncbi:MAG: PQQ-dependent sugar dehydrogenase [Chitinophagales bacterium]|nr:PQQ-dependent sugar dehydrogenase [Chitinophagales bacterium]
MNKLICTVMLFLLTHILSAQPAIGLQTISSGFNSPVDIANAGDERLFIVEQDGFIQILHPDGATSTFLNIDARVGSGGSEQGLLGLAFHPDYGSNGYFYVNYTNNSGNTRISRFSVNPLNPDLADATSESILLTITQPFDNHNGGDLEFGPDGYLYIPTGDGGSGGDPGNRAQDITSQKLGKILRIDVDGGSPYAIPADNPFVGITGDDEIWAYGLRNPWRFSFDRLTGDMWTGDVGQDDWEEINFQPASSTGGENYGWRCYEGNHEFNTSLCDLGATYFFPVYEYPHSFATGGFALTGGYVYRGSEFPGMYGYYVATDFVTGNFWIISPDGIGGFTTEFLGNIQSDISSFGEGMDGEIYACNLSSGDIYHMIDENCGPVWGVEVTDITSSSATISWQDVGSANYKVSYKKPGSPWTNLTTASTSIDLAGLTASTAYSYRIKNKCPGATGLNLKTGSFMTNPLRKIDDVLTKMPILVSNNGDNRFIVTNPGADNVLLQITTITGEIVFGRKVHDGEEIIFERIESGIYIAQFIGDNGTLQTQKIYIHN